jgi:hypothetical protein
MGGHDTYDIPLGDDADDAALLIGDDQRTHAVCREFVDRLGELFVRPERKNVVPLLGENSFNRHCVLLCVQPARFNRPSRSQGHGALSLPPFQAPRAIARKRVAIFPIRC